MQIFIPQKIFKNMIQMFRTCGINGNWHKWKFYIFYIVLQIKAKKCILRIPHVGFHWSHDFVNKILTPTGLCTL